MGTMLDVGATDSPERLWYVVLYLVFVLSLNVLYIPKLLYILVYK